MARKWRNSETSIDTGKGNLSLDKGLYTNKARDSIRFSLRTEEGNPAGRKYYDKKTGKILENKPQYRAYEIDDETEVTLERTEIDKLKEIAYSSDGWNIQKVISKTEIPTQRLCKEAKQVKPNEGSETSLEYLWNGLMETGKALVVKHAPNKNENLYVIYADQDGLWQQQMHYPQEFEAGEREVTELEEETREKTAQLVQRLEEQYDTQDIVNNQRQKLEEAIEKKLAGEELDIETDEQEEKEEELEALI